MSNKIYAKYHFKIFDNLIVKKRLEIAMVDVAVEKEKTGQLIEIVTRESADAQKEADIAAI